MAQPTTRWFCNDCKREWIEPTEYFANSAPVSISGNPWNGQNCIVCGSCHIELIQFTPLYPGLDIPREGSIKQIPVERVVSIDGIDGHHQMNLTKQAPSLALVSKHQPGHQPEQDVILTPEENVLITPEEEGIYDLSDMD